LNYEEFFDDDLERMLYYRLPTSNLMFGGLMNISSLFSFLRKKRKHVEKKEEVQEEITKIPTKELETISI
jgi:hypothetical protein